MDEKRFELRRGAGAKELAFITTLLNELPEDIPIPVKVTPPVPALTVRLEVGVVILRPPKIVPNVTGLLLVVIASEVLFERVIVAFVGKVTPEEVEVDEVRLTGEGLVKEKAVPLYE